MIVEPSSPVPLPSSKEAQCFKATVEYQTPRVMETGMLVHVVPCCQEILNHRRWPTAESMEIIWNKLQPPNARRHKSDLLRLPQRSGRSPLGLNQVVDLSPDLFCRRMC